MQFDSAHDADGRPCGALFKEAVAWSVPGAVHKAAAELEYGLGDGPHHKRACYRLRQARTVQHTDVGIVPYNMQRITLKAEARQWLARAILIEKTVLDAEALIHAAGDAGRAARDRSLDQPLVDALLEVAHSSVRLGANVIDALNPIGSHGKER